MGGKNADLCQPWEKCLGGCPKSFSWYDNAHFFPWPTLPQTALVPLGALPPPSPPFLTAGSSWQAQAHLNSSMVSTFPRTTTLYYYGYPPLGSGAPLRSSDDYSQPRDTQRPSPAGLRAGCVSCAVSLLQAQTERRAGASQTHTDPRIQQSCLDPHSCTPPPVPPARPESLSEASDRSVPPTRAGSGREERRAGPTASRLPAPVEAARVGRGAEPEFRKRRGRLSSMKSYS